MSVVNGIELQVERPAEDTASTTACTHNMLNTEDDELKLCTAMLGKAFSVVETKAHTIVDDTSIEKLLSHLDEFSNDIALFDRIMFNEKASTIEFLKSKKVRETEISLAFAFRLATLIAKTSKKNFFQLISSGTLNELYSAVKNIVGDPGSRIDKMFLRSATLLALKTLLQSQFSYQWVEESGMINFCLDNFSCASYHVRKDASKAFELFLANRGTDILPPSLLVKIASLDKPSHLCLLNSLQNILPQSAERVKLFLKNTRIMAKLVQYTFSLEHPGEFLGGTLAFVESILMNDSNIFESVIGYSNFSELLSELILLLKIKTDEEKDWNIFLGHVHCLVIRQNDIANEAMRDWNDNLMRCLANMLSILLGSFNKAAYSLPHEESLIAHEISCIFDNFERTVYGHAENANGSEIVKLFMAMLINMETFIKKFDENMITITGLELIRNLVSDIIQFLLLPQVGKIQIDSSLPYTYLNHTNRNRCKIACFKLAITILKTPFEQVVEDDIIISFWSAVCVHPGTPFFPKIFSICRQLLPLTCKRGLLTDATESAKKKLKTSEEIDRTKDLLKIIGNVVSVGIRNEDWGVRDDALELTGEILIYLSDENLSVLEGALKMECWSQSLKKIWVLFGSDNSFVKAAVVDFFTKTHTRKILWDLLLGLWMVSENELLQRTIETMKCEPEAFPRRAAVRLFRSWISSKIHWISETAEICASCNKKFGITITVKNLIMSALESSLNDFDWEVRQGGVMCIEHLLYLPKQQELSTDTPLETGETVFDEKNQLNKKDKMHLHDCSIGLLSERLHFFNHLKLTSRLENAANDYDIQVSCTAANVTRVFCRLIDEFLGTIPASVNGTYYFLDYKEFLPCEETFRALLHLRKTATGTFDKAEENDGLAKVRTLTSFLTDVVAAAEPTKDNLLDCY